MAIFLSLGSNLEEKRGHCEKALSLLKECFDILFLNASQWHATKALTLAGETHPDFLNGVVKIETPFTPFELLYVCKTVEYAMGRRFSEKRWQPRPIDIDILFYKNHILDTEHLKIPHPELHRRPFVLHPFQEIEPAWRHPLLKQTIAELLRGVTEEAES